jgi:hypothetical protein
VLLQHPRLLLIFKVPAIFVYMTTVTIPQELAKRGDLVVIPRKEYEALLEFKKIKEFAPTAAQKKSLFRAERNFRNGKTIPYDALVKKLGFRD